MVMVNSSGIAGIAEAQPLGVAAADGGIRVILRSVHTGLRIYDLSGKLIIYAPEISGGEIFAVPQGVYIVTDDQTRHPLTVIIR